LSVDGALQTAQAGVDGARALDRVRVVLVRTRDPMNLGAAARALRNAGIRNWTLVDPQVDLDHPDVARVAVRAEGLLQLARVVPTLAEALDGCPLSAATTARQRHDRMQLHPRAAAARLISGVLQLQKAAARGEGDPAARPACPEVALVFGDETNGLSTEETLRCDLLTTVPSAPEQPSWNLAQAVAVFGHELRTAALEAELADDPPGDRADGRTLAALDRMLAAVLEACGRGRTRRRLFRSLERAQLGRREAALWTGALENVRRRMVGEPQTGGSGGPDRARPPEGP
jgi:tRNA/rRNA methyltransferase/tRNA (cytidine32/uridine32-2'-O)-methyltransferase